MTLAVSKSLLVRICLTITDQNEFHFTVINNLREIKDYDSTLYFVNIDRISCIESKIWQSDIYQWLETNGPSAFTSVANMGSF